MVGEPVGALELAFYAFCRRIVRSGSSCLSPREAARCDPQALPQPADWPRVEIVSSYAGGSAAVVEALLAHGVDALVVAGTGNGTLHHALEAALLRARGAGVEVRRTTRCPFGRVLPLPDDVLPAAEGLSPVKARIAVLLELMR